MAEFIAETPAEKRPKKKQKPRAQRLRELVDEVEDAEVWLEQVERALAAAGSAEDAAEMESLQEELAAAQATLDALVTEWDELQI